MKDCPEYTMNGEDGDEDLDFEGGAMGKQATIAPTHDNVLVQEIIAPERTEGGIYVPEVARDDKTLASKGQVLAAGDGKMPDGTSIKMTVARGDTVFYHRYPSSAIVGDGLKIIPLKQIVAVCK